MRARFDNVLARWMKTSSSMQYVACALPRGGAAVTSQLLASARTTSDNAFTVPLVQRTIDAILTDAAQADRGRRADQRHGGC
jgi:hypothetical protein